MRLNLIFGVMALILLVAGCQSQLNDVVGSQLPSNLIPTPTPKASRASFKISPGSMREATQHYSISATVSPTTQNLKSANMSARVGISRQPANHQ